MVEAPWYVENYRAFLLASLLAVVLFLAPMFPWMFTPYMDDWIDLVEDADEPGFFMVMALIPGILGYSYFKTFQRYWEVVEALGDRLVSVEVVGFMRHTSLHCTTYDGRSFYLYYFGGAKHMPAYYKLSIDLPDKLPRFDATPHVNAIYHLMGIEVEYGDVEGQDKLVAKLSDQWFVSETKDILASLDALHKIRDEKRK